VKKQRSLPRIEGNAAGLILPAVVLMHTGNKGLLCAVTFSIQVHKVLVS